MEGWFRSSLRTQSGGGVGNLSLLGMVLLILLLLGGVHGALMKICVVGREGVADLFRLLDERDSVSKSSSSFILIVLTILMIGVGHFFGLR